MSKLYLKLAGIVSGIAGVFGAGVASAAAGDLFTLPTAAVASTTAYIGDLFTDLGPFVWLAIGIPLGFFVIRKVISMVAGRAR